MNNRIKYNPKYNKQRRERRNRLRNFVFDILGRSCVICGFDDIRGLQIDHVNGGGSKERRENFGVNYITILKNLEKDPKYYQILCANCNWIKRFDKIEVKK